MLRYTLIEIKFHFLYPLHGNTHYLSKHGSFYAHKWKIFLIKKHGFILATALGHLLECCIRLRLLFTLKSQLK